MFSTSDLNVAKFPHLQAQQRVNQNEQQVTTSASNANNSGRLAGVAFQEIAALDTQNGMPCSLTCWYLMLTVDAVHCAAATLTGPVGKKPRGWRNGGLRKDTTAAEVLTAAGVVDGLRGMAVWQRDGVQQLLMTPTRQVE